MLLDDIKDILNIADNSQDNVISLYVRRAITLIKNYLLCGDSVNIEDAYPDAVIEYVTIAMNKRGNEGLKQFAQGSRSGTYDSGILPESVIFLLPAPYAKLLETSPKPTGVILS